MNLLKKWGNIIPTIIPPQYNAPKWFFIALFCGTLTLIMPSCKVKEGCPTKSFTNSMEKNNKRGKSNLFDKNMRKKMKN
jgi:hypothetical protein